MALTSCRAEGRPPLEPDLRTVVRPNSPNVLPVKLEVLTRCDEPGSAVHKCIYECRTIGFSEIPGTRYGPKLDAPNDYYGVLMLRLHDLSTALTRYANSMQRQQQLHDSNQWDEDIATARELATRIRKSFGSAGHFTRNDAEYLGRLAKDLRRSVAAKVSGDPHERPLPGDSRLYLEAAIDIFRSLGDPHEDAEPTYAWRLLESGELLREDDSAASAGWLTTIARDSARNEPAVEVHTWRRFVVPGWETLCVFATAGYSHEIPNETFARVVEAADE